MRNFEKLNTLECNKRVFEFSSAETEHDQTSKMVSTNECFDEQYQNTPNVM